LAVEPHYVGDLLASLSEGYLVGISPEPVILGTCLALPSANHNESDRASIGHLDREVPSMGVPYHIALPCRGRFQSLEVFLGKPSLVDG
jgi:hypothetical protein